MKVFVFAAARCNGCYGCQLVCKDEHVDNDWTPIAKPQPDTGQFWMKVHETVHGSVPKVKVEYRPMPCMHCDDAPCIKAAKDGAVYKRDDGMVIIDPAKAEGQRQIVDSCPYGAVYWNEELSLPQKCTGCAHLLDEGEIPRCVDACAVEALKFGEEEDFKDLIAKAEIMRPELGLRPRVYYIDLPKFFVAGEVCDPVADEVIENASVYLTNTATGKTWTENTDDFGDFWFKKLEPGEYSLKIVKEGYAAGSIDGITVDKSINVGPIPLQPVKR